jgi:hypothetical protein
VHAGDGRSIHRGPLGNLEPISRALHLRFMLWFEVEYGGDGTVFCFLIF